MVVLPAVSLRRKIFVGHPVVKGARKPAKRIDIGVGVTDVHAITGRTHRPVPRFCIVQVNLSNSKIAPAKMFNVAQIMKSVPPQPAPGPVQ